MSTPISMISADSPLHQLAKLPPPDKISRKPKKDIWTSLNNLRRRGLVNFTEYIPQSIVFCLLLFKHGPHILLRKCQTSLPKNICLGQRLTRYISKFCYLRRQNYDPDISYFLLEKELKTCCQSRFVLL